MLHTLIADFENISDGFSSLKSTFISKLKSSNKNSDNNEVKYLSLNEKDHSLLRRIFPTFPTHHEFCVNNNNASKSPLQISCISFSTSKGLFYLYLFYFIFFH
jgi:hypothetical protein